MTKKLDEIDPRMSSAGAFSALALQDMLNNGILNPNTGRKPACKRKKPLHVISYPEYEQLKLSAADEKRYRKNMIRWSRNSSRSVPRSMTACMRNTCLRKRLRKLRRDTGNSMTSWVRRFRKMKML